MSDTTALTRTLLALILLAAVLRLATLGVYPLTDNTEARYAEIGREMVATGNWVTPQLDDGKPFWAKPPLSIWLTAASFKVFGINEFSARLPTFLLAAGTLWLSFLLARRLYGRETGLLASAVLSSSLLFFLLAGGVMTDPALGFTTTLIMVSLILALETNSRLWGHLLFVGAGLGMLAKGPIALVLTGFPVFIWLFWKRQWGHFFRDLPWLTGIPLMLLIAIPWYVMAELRTPGFLEYFFVGEHYKRFVDPSWAGDLYGAPHNQPKGMIWIFWLAAALPWSLVFIGMIAARLFGYGRDRQLFNVNDRWLVLLSFWAVTPMLFFTTASSILATYVYPGIPAFALLMALGLQRGAQKELRRPRLLYLGMALVPIVFAAGVSLMHQQIALKASQLPLLQQFHAQAEPNAILAYACERPNSAEFYGRGKTYAMEGANEQQWRHLFADGAHNYAVIEHDRYQSLPPFLSKRMTEVGRYGKYQLLRETGLTQPGSDTSDSPHPE
jgi:4-amino-4-deoxy-L-arabinose transferase-like glycosyltransferase